MDCCTVEIEDLQELAAEVRAVKKRLAHYCARSTYRERRLLELVATLARRLDPPEGGPVVTPPPGTLADLRARATRQALDAARGNKFEAARSLGVNVKTVYLLMKRAGLPIGYGRPKRREVAVRG